MNRDSLKIYGIWFLLLSVLLGGVFYFQKQHAPKRPVLPVNFFLPERFWDGVNNAEKDSENKKIYAAVVPHHLLAGRLISNMFEKLKSQGVRNVIIVGPNHHETGAKNIQYNDTDWQSPLGIVKGLSIKTGYEQTEEKFMENEHSVSGLMPYVTEYLPNAKVFSLILKYNTSESELEELANSLSKLMDKDTVVIFSIDFSHYLPLEVAEKRDEYTKQVLLNMNEGSARKMNNDFVDSPASVITMFKLCKKLKAQLLTIEDHANSAVILNNRNLLSTTSYFTGSCAQ